MKSLQESLFDKNLIQKNVGSLEVITSYISDYLNKHLTDDKYNRTDTPRMEWFVCLKNIEDSLKISKANGINLKRRIQKIKEDEFYVAIDDDSIILIGYGLDDDPPMIPNIPPLIKISFSHSFNQIFLDRTRSLNGYTYKRNIDITKFNRYKLDKSSIKSFIDNVYKKVEHVF